MFFVRFSLIFILRHALATINLSVDAISVFVSVIMFCASARICEQRSALTFPENFDRSLSNFSNTSLHSLFGVRFFFELTDIVLLCHL